MKNRFILWKDGKVIFATSLFVDINANIPIYCVDTAFSEETSEGMRDRYGISSLETIWKHVPLNEFPKEFRAALLLLL